MVKRGRAGKKQRGRAGKKPTKKRTIAKTRYVVNAVFNMISPRMSKTRADKLARSVRAKGGRVTVKKV